jgi:hypothetical protein
MDNKKHAIIIRGDKSKWYEEMIVVLRCAENKIPPNVVNEAENIIKEYMKNKKGKSIITNKKMPTRSRRDINLILNIVIFSLCVFVFCLICYIISGVN